MNETVSDTDHRATDRRILRSPLHFPDRRTGFDRRFAEKRGWRRSYDGALRCYRDNKTTFLLVLATIIVFNYVDYVLTVRVLQAGGMELNPIMARLFDISPVVAAAAKIGAVGAAALVLLALRRYRRTLEVSLVLLVSFSALMFYHASLAVQIAG